MILLSPEKIFSTVQPKGLRFDVASQILSAIFRGQIKAGERLVVSRLANEFGVSATPAREALLELSSFGAVELLPNKGAVVRPFGSKQIEEIYNVRALLEAEATRSACGRISISELTDLRAETIEFIENESIPQWSERSVAHDRRLHSLIAHSCGQQYLAYEIDRVGKLVSVARGLLGEMRLLQKIAHQEHLQLIDALLAEDQEAAADAMRNHVRSACRILVKEAFPDLSEEQAR